MSLVDGDSLTYYSTSSYLDGSLSLEDQLEEFVPGGASLILYGRTSSGRLVRNRFFWVYSNSCEEGSDETVLEGDKVGWVTIVSILVHLMHFYVRIALVEGSNRSFDLLIIFFYP